MPYLRFSRDKRGYENTYVFHGTKTDGKSRPRMLYWFRTPPNVKVGRLSLDESAIRAIEENNPDLSFDWSKMLKVRGMPPPSQKGQPSPRRGRRGRRVTRDAPPPVQATDPDTLTAGGAGQEQPEQAEGPGSDFGLAPPPVKPEPVESVDADEVAAEAHLDALADSATPLGEPDELQEHPVVALMGHETLARLRARYAEIQARIAEKPMDPELAQTIRTQAEKLNPDRWTEIEAAVAGIERFEAEVEAVKGQLGRRPPRKRRVDGPGS